KCSNTISFGIAHIVSEHNGFPFNGHTINGFFEESRKALTIKQAITQNQTYNIIPNKAFTDDKCLCQPVRGWLFSILQGYSKTTPIAQKLPKQRQILWCRNNEDIPDVGKHQCR